jgi:SAM-dependent methyltransferase
MDRTGFMSLISPQGQALLAEVGEIDSKADMVKVVSKLRGKGHSAELVATVLTQVKLRRRAKAKFGEFAPTMFFTEEGLEQASRLKVAAIHAGRFRNHGLKRIADLGCGIGAESLAIASLDMEVTAFEIDEVTAALATYNLASFENVKVEQADVTTINLDNFDGLFIDPARRDLKDSKTNINKRKYDINDFSPSFDFVLEAARTKPTIVKLGPGLDHKDIPDDAEAVWVSDDGDLVELTLYFGILRRPEVKRAALLLSPNGTFEITSSEAERLDAPLGELGRYLYEPDASIIRSHLVGNLAISLELNIFSNEIAYLSSDEEVHSPWLKGYEVLENLVFDRKKLKAYLREKNIGVLEIKKRGADITPEQLRRELDPKGTESATLIVTRVDGAHRVLIVRAL